MPNPEDAVIDAIDKLVDWQMTDSPAARREHGASGYAYNTQLAQLHIRVIPVRLDTSPVLRALHAIEGFWALASAVSADTLGSLPIPECCGNIVTHRPECRHTEVPDA